MKHPLKILGVDDDPKIRKLLERGLESFGYEVITAENGQEALRLAAQQSPNIIILDLNLGSEPNGLEVCRQLRDWTNVPIIVLSVRNEQRIKIAALNIGADDYITKPFDMSELEVRIRAIIRRTTIEETGILKAEIRVHELMIDLVKRRVTMKGEEIHFTPKEYELLRLLATNAGRVLTYPTLLEAVWGSKIVTADHYVRVYINTIRKKLGDDMTSETHYIITEPGIGYRFIDIE